MNLPVADVRDLRLVIVGSVDHGKSTLVGRLLHDLHALADGKFEQIKASCDRRGMPFEWAFLMDALQAERDQNVTIDTTQIWFSSAKRRYCLIDAPGHREFLKNMITGAACADAALLLVDAAEGLKAQSRRHARLLQLLGVEQLLVVINKMDLVDYDEARFAALAEEFKLFLSQLGISPVGVVPISARDGQGLVAPAGKMPWYRGAPLMAQVDALKAAPSASDLPLRLTVQDVYRFDARRILAGRVESGTLQLGDELLFSPGGGSARIATIERWPEKGEHKQQAMAGESIGITLDEPIFVERGQIASHTVNPPLLSNLIKSQLFWMQESPLRIGMRLRLRCASADYRVEVRQILSVTDSDSLAAQSDADMVEKMQVAEVLFRVKGIAAIDDFQHLPRSGRFVLFDGYRLAGGGVIRTDGVPDLRKAAQTEIKSAHISRIDFAITPEARAQQNGHASGVLWFTGLSGAGKSTLAKELQQRLFAKGYQVYVLDGDNIRHGLCSDLGFSAADRSENIRRIGEVAKLFADAGKLVIVAFISPYNEDRRRARAITGANFHTIYIDADLETCAARDTKGLYAMAMKGEIKDFTGISAPYEVPEFPDLVVNTSQQDVDDCVALLMRYVQQEFALMQEL